MNTQPPTNASPLPPNRRFWLAVAAVLALALALRIIPLTLKAPWMDEAATTIFSLGNSSRSMPVNQVVDLQSFLRPLTGRPGADPAAVLHHLINEDNHPPLYFLLAHGWYYLLQPGSGLASIGISRLLPALFGVLAVPLSLWTGWLALGTRRGALLSGLWMAISPLAVAQSLEIRHYSLAIVLSAASLLCFVKTWSLDQQGKRLPMSWLLGWLGINATGVATHYFFVFALLMQLASTALLMRRNSRAWAALLASMASAALWLPLLSNFAGSSQSSWLKLDPTNIASLLAIPLQALVGVLFNAVAPGTYAVHVWQWPFAISAGLATLAGLALLVRLLLQTCKRGGTGTSGSALQMFAVLVGSGLVVQIGISLGMLSDYTKGFRYSFFLIPPAVALLASLCEQVWRQRRSQADSAVMALLACGLICAAGVDAGAVLPKWYAGDLLVQRIAQESENPIVLAYDHIPVSTGPMVIGLEPLSVAWWIGQHPQLQSSLRKAGTPVRLAMAIDGPGMPGANRTEAKAAVEAIPTAFDLWVIGGNPETFTTQRCDLRSRGSEGSHSFSHYRCKAPSAP